MTQALDIEAIKAELRKMQAHKEAFEQSMQRIMSMLSEQKEPLKTGVADQAVARYEARRRIARA